MVLFRPAEEETPPITKIARYTETQQAIGQRATAYVCTNFICKLPTTEVAKMLSQLRERASAEAR